MDEKGGWKKFQKLKFDTKSLSKRAQRAETMTTRHAHKFIIQRLATIKDVRQHVTLWLMIVGVLIAATAVQMFWSQSGYKTTAATSGGIYAEATLGPINTLNPLYAQSSAEQSAAKLIFSGLLDYDETGHLRDNLATGIQTDNKKQVYTVTLRQDAKWHDGQSVRADDIVFTVDTMKNPDVRSVMRSSWLDVSAVATDDYTVEFRLPSPHAAFPHALTFAVLPKHILESVQPGAMRENIFSVSPIGSGPFSFRLLQSGNVREDHKIVHLNKSDDYYRGAAKLSRFELHAYKTPNAIARALVTRDVNAATGVNSVVDQIPKDLDKELVPVNAGVFALFNTDREKMLANKTIRKALQIGTDTDKLRKALTVEAPVLNTPLPARQIEGLTLPAKPKLDIAQANRMLDKAGWKLGGDGIRTKNKRPLTLDVAVLKDEYPAEIESLKQQWKVLGVGVNINEFDATTNSDSFAQTVLRPRNYDVLVSTLDIGADPDVFAYWHSSQANSAGLNFSNYRSSVSDDLLLSARLRSEPALRAQKYNTFTKQWLSDAPAIALYQTVEIYAHTKRTNSLEPSDVLPNIVDRYNNVQYWTADEAQVYKTP